MRESPIDLLFLGNLLVPLAMVRLGIIYRYRSINHRTETAAMFSHHGVDYTQINMQKEHKENYDEGYVMNDQAPLKNGGW